MPFVWTSANIELVFWKIFHHRNQCLEVFLGSGLTDGKEELLVAFDEFWLSLQLQIRVFDAIVNHIQRLIPNIDVI